MNNILANRFIEETSKKKLNIEEKSILELHTEEQKEYKENNSPIVTPELLKEKILEKLNPNPKIIMEQNLNESFKIDLIHFSTLEEFVSWYEKNKTSFEEKQQKPLDTLVDARNMTIGGCNCNLQQRKNFANSYFRDFWINNKSTDLISTLQKIVNAKKIIFGDFLSYPS